MRAPRLTAGLVKSYGVGIVSVATAFAATYATWPALRPTPWAFFFAAVLASAWFEGLGPSLLATALAAALGNVFFLGPSGRIPTATFVAVSLFIGVFGSARRRAEAFERAASRRFRATMLSIGDAVIATDADGRVAFMNGIAEELTGWTGREAQGKRLEDVFVIVNEATRAAVPSPVERVFKTGRIQGLANHTILVARDGKERPIDDSAAPIRDDAGGLAGAVLVFRDISERRAAEQDRARLAAIVASSDDAIVAKTLDGTIRSWNAGAERIFGYTAAEAAGQPITLIVPADRLDEERDILEHIRRGERVEPFETVRVAKGGRRVDISVTVSPIRDEHGRVVGASKTARDVTERKAADAERARLAETLRLALEAADLGTWEWDPETDQIALSERGAEIYGVAPGRTYSREWMRGLLHPDDRPRAREAAARAAADRSDYDIEYRLDRPGDRLAWVSARGRGVFGPDGRLVRMLGVVQDVTARREAEAALRQSEERLRRAVSIGTVGVLFFRLDGRITDANDAFLRMCDYGGDELRSAVRWEALMPPESAAVTARATAELADRGETAPFETPLIRKDGSRRWVVLAPMRLSRSGRESECVAFAIDITDRKRAEEDLREADRQKDEFLAMLAHELRNPLSAAGIAVALLRVSDDPGSVAFARDVISRQLRHLTRLIDDLLDVSRISRGKIELRKDVQDASPILDGAVESVMPLVSERKHALEVSIERGHLWVDADPTRLEQVVVNLLNNAAKYSENAGRIRLSARNEQGSVVIRVEDEGVGIPPEKLPQMFELFAQGDRSLARSEGGLGIGLTVVKKLVELHGGTVGAWSDGPGKGSTFTIRLPAATPREPAAPAPAPCDPAGTPGQPARILVVDDNEDTARGMSRLLRLLGHDAVTAHSGPEAIEAARAHRPEFVLLDIGLPGMDGYEVASRLRGEACCKDAVIVAISGYGREEDRRRSREAGFDHHLIKPLDHDALLGLLSAAGNGRG